MDFRQFVHGVALLLMLVGAGALIEGTHTPPFTDAERAGEILYRDFPRFETREDSLAFSAEWHRDMRAVRTLKWETMNLGAGFLALGLSLLAAMRYAARHGAAKPASWNTPAAKVRIAGLWTIAWFGFLAGEVLSLYQEHDRFYFPAWADTLAIPLSGIVILGIGFYPVLLAILALALRRAELPAPLWITRPDAPWRGRLATFFTGAAVTLLLAIVPDTLVYGHWLQMPLILLWIYGLLALRAAALSGIGKRKNAPPRIPSLPAASADVYNVYN